MVRIALVGDPGSGGTTVLGLLYATQVRWTSAEASSFRFYVAPSSMPRVGAIYEALQAGQFPARTTVQSGPPIEFLFERRQTLAASLRERWLVGRRPPDEAIRIEWTRATFSDLRAHLVSGGFPTEGARQMEGADVLAVLVPLPFPDGSGAGPNSNRDDALARAVSAAGAQNPAGARSSTVFAFIFTMLDRLPDARRKELGLAASLQETVPPEGRERIGLRLLQESFPKTAVAIGLDRLPDRSGGVRSRFFFSWLETDPVDADRPRLRSSPGGGWEPVYPFEEYVALIGACNGWADGRR